MGDVFLLGGTSRSGKSDCAAELRRRTRVEPLSLDAIRVHLEDVAYPGDPIRYFRGGCDWLDRSPAEISEKQRMVLRLAWPCIETAIREAAKRGSALLAEGVDVLPEDAASLLSDSVVTGVAFLVLTDLGLVRQRFLADDRTGCISGDPSRMGRFLGHYAAIADRVTAEAARFRLRVIDASGYVGHRRNLVAAIGAWVPDLPSSRSNA